MNVTKIFQIILISNILLCVSINCSTNDIEPKVVSGEVVPIEKYPHAAYLKVMLEGGNYCICGSSILNQYLLLSAAHCMDEIHRRRGNMWAYAGHENINEINVIILVRKTYIHEDYNENLQHSFNDIALMLLETALTFDSHIQRIIINNRFPKVTTGYLAGWGLVDDEDEIRSFWLQSISQKMQDPLLCVQRIARKIPGVFCAGSNNNKDPRPASGDSGSGLITKNHELIGILSFKSERFPALPYYTNVTYFYPWIIRKAEQALKLACIKL